MSHPAHVEGLVNTYTDQSGPGSNGNEEVHHTLQIPRTGV